MEVKKDSGDELEVKFTKDEQEVTFKAEVEDGAVVPSVESDSDDEPDGGDD